MLTKDSHAACNSVDDNRLNAVKADTSLMDRPRPSNTNFGESLLYYSYNIAYNKPTALSLASASYTALCMTFTFFVRILSLYYRTFYGEKDMRMRKQSVAGLLFRA